VRSWPPVWQSRPDSEFGVVAGQARCGGWRRQPQAWALVGRARSSIDGICKAQAWPDQVRVEQDVAIGSLRAPIQLEHFASPIGSPSSRAQMRRSCRRAAPCTTRCRPPRARCHESDWECAASSHGRSVAAIEDAPVCLSRPPARRRESRTPKPGHGQAAQESLHRKGRTSLTNPEFPR